MPLLNHVLMPLSVSLTLFGCGSPPRSVSASTTSAATPEPSTDKEVSRSPHVRFGIPVDADPSDDYLIDRAIYVASYNRNLGEPNWVAWRLTRDDLGTVGRRDHFQTDDGLPSEFRRVGPGDYTASGYDKGHLCPSAHRTYDATANAATFLMTNMTPQVHALNAGPWKAIESHERELVAVQGMDVYVVAGGVFGSSPKTIGHGVAVPTSSYRVTIVVQHGQGPSDVTDATTVLAVEMPNDNSAKGHKWQEFRVSVDRIERDSGYDFLAALPDGVEDRLEAQVPNQRADP